MLLRPEHWVTVLITAGTCIPALVTQIGRLFSYVPRMLDRSAPPLDRIEAENRVFGAVIAIFLTAFAIVVVAWFAIHEATGS